jgi:cell wall assembly regulator SMI1
MMPFLQRFRTTRHTKIHRPATDDEIELVEKKAGLRFPDDYREFLRTFGWAEMGMDTIYGLGPDTTQASNVWDNMVVESAHADPPLRSSLVPLMNDGAGSHYCLNTARMRGGRCPVVFWDHEDPEGELQKPKVVAKSFEEWVSKLLDDLGPS